MTFCNKPRAVVTNGCFDAIHYGHIFLFKKIKEMFPYAKLRVLVNSDESIKRIKGPSRPFNCEEHRIETLKAIRYVDEVQVFNEDTPLEAMREIQNQGNTLIVIKGRGYKKEDVIAPEGAQIIVIEEDLGMSSTQLIDKMRK